MDAHEEKLLAELKEANVELKGARAAFDVAKRKLTEAETGIINAKIHVERLTEQLRNLHIQRVVPGQHYSLFDDDDGG